MNIKYKLFAPDVSFFNIKIKETQGESRQFKVTQGNFRFKEWQPCGMSIGFYIFFLHINLKKLNQAHQGYLLKSCPESFNDLDLTFIVYKNYYTSEKSTNILFITCHNCLK